MNLINKHIHISFFILICILINNIAYAQDFVISENSDVVIDTGAEVIIEGDLIAASSTEISLYDRILIRGGIDNQSINTSLFSELSTGSVILDGSIEQSVTGAGEIYFPNLKFDNASGFSVSQNINVGLNLDLSNGIIHNASNIITVGTSSLSPGSVTIGAGHLSGVLKRWVVFDDGTKSGEKSSTVVFPIGDSTSVHTVTIAFGAVSPGGSLSGFFDTSINGDDTFISPPVFDGTQLINNISSKGFWDFDNNDGMLESGFTYTLTAQISDVTADDASHEVGNPNDLRMLRRDDSLSDWEIAGDFGSATYNDVDDIVEITINNLADKFGDFALGGDSLVNPLPICLMDFWLDCAGDHIDIYWETLSEINNWYFTVEKSHDLVNWKLVQEVQGQGNSTQNFTYHLSDYELSDRITYYRLKQTDYNGSTTTYDAESIFCHGGSGTTSGLSIHSLLAKEGLLKVKYISNTTSVNYQILTINGNVFLSGTLNDVQLNSINELSRSVPRNGLYILRLSNSHGAAIQKFISF
ncbi:MAG: T9SS type A sorting domain-containing protein [Bacteroidales bacterium]